jgi:glutamate racemase
MKDYSIGVFDSGVGGITVLKQIKLLLPNEDIIYFGDNGNAPYGDRDKTQIEQLSVNIADFLIKHHCKAIVIACNTATAAAVETIRKKYSNIPVIGVIEPGARMAVQASQNKKIGVMATQFTVNTKSYMKEIEKFKNDNQVYQVGCKPLCPMIETGWESFDNRDEVIKEFINQLPEDIDTLVLGCTHYPIIQKDISKYFKGTIVDPALESAKELKKQLEDNSLLADRKEGKLNFYVSGEKEKFQRVAEKFLGMSIDNLSQITL